jgi:cyclase
MLTKRIIPCLDIKDGQVVKGVNFKNLVNEGNPIELAKRYSDEGADELVFLDISASLESRSHVVDLVEQVAKSVFIPFTVGGGIRETADIEKILMAGADKVSINSAAIDNPELITDGASIFGSQCIVVALDVKRINDKWIIYSHGGTRPTTLEAVAWAGELVKRGAGEILLTSMDADGTQAGIDLEITKRISEAVPIPVIASGGIGEKAHFKEACTIGLADAVLAASIFHRKILSIQEIKEYLGSNNIPIRLNGVK